MVAAKSTVRNKRKKRVLVIIAVIKITLFACYFVLKSTKFDEEELLEITRATEASVETDSEWKEDLREIMETLSDDDDDDDDEQRENDDDDNKELNECFPLVQHDGDLTWGSYANMNKKKSGYTENLDRTDDADQAVLFKKIMKKIDEISTESIEEECLETKPYDDRDNFLKKASCALVFPTGNLVVAGAGAQIEAHDYVVRLNAHNAPKKFSRDAKDFGHRTDVRAITAALVNIGLDHAISYQKNTENWLMFSQCSHRSPQPWCVKLNQKLKHKPVKSLRFIKGESHRGVLCLKKLTKETHGNKQRYDKTPTTGFSTLLYLTRQCGCVTVFGLCNTTKCEHLLDWSGHSDRTGWKDPVHNFNIEHIAAAVMAKKIPDNVQLWVSHKGMRKEAHSGSTNQKLVVHLAEKVKDIFSTKAAVVA